MASGKYHMASASNGDSNAYEHNTTFVDGICTSDVIRNKLRCRDENPDTPTCVWTIYRLCLWD
jgi:hypothetical protein